MKTAVIPVLAAALAVAPVTPPTAFADAPAIIREASSVDALVEGLMADIRASKSLPRWAVDAAVNAYAVYKTYRNGQRVKEIGATVLAVLKEVADIKADAEKGREMTEREYRLTRELLDDYVSRLRAYEELLASYGARLQAHERTLASLMSDTKAIRAQLAAWRYRNRLCREAEHVWRPNLGCCVHISVAGPRR
jgi:hypothetical protein